jgi:uncharacterized protein DUF6171
LEEVVKVPNLKNAAKSACRVVKAVVKGDPLLLDEASVKQRLAACEKCEFLDKTIRQCQKCSCQIDLKSMLATERCPLHKWVSTNK